MTLCESAFVLLSQYFSQGMSCGPNEAGYEVLVTPLCYPDMDNIELFIKQAPDGKFLVSDLGQTMMKLADYGFVPANAPRRRAMIHQITTSMNVRYENGNILVVANESELGARTWDLLLALYKLSDLAFTVPGYTRATFIDEFENYMVDRNLLPYERGAQLQLDTGVTVAMDFVVGQTKLVHLLSAGSLGYARERRDRVYVNFNELIIAKDQRERIAVIDDSQSDIWRDDILVPLRHVTNHVLLWSRKRQLEETLKAS